jgi:hypothetical protein
LPSEEGDGEDGGDGGGKVEMVEKVEKVRRRVYYDMCREAQQLML